VASHGLIYTFTVLAQWKDIAVGLHGIGTNQVECIRWSHVAQLTGLNDRCGVVSGQAVFGRILSKTEISQTPRAVAVRVTTRVALDGELRG
jgi:hypothetical protein